MTTSSGRKHAGPGPASDQPPFPEPTFAERARTLVYLGRVGSLSTLSRKQPGFPFGSVMPYGLDDHGRPIFLISTMAMHTQNLQADARASLLVTQEDIEGEPLGASRVTLVGNVLPVPNSEFAEGRKLYLERHANSKYWVDFEDFSFYRMDVVDVYYVGGFGVMGWVSASDYDRSQPDPLADSMPRNHSAHERRPQGRTRPACADICSDRVNGGDDDRGRSPWLSCPLENAGWHARCPHCILEGGKQSGGNSKGLGGNGATRALERQMSSTSGTQLAHGSDPKGQRNRGLSTDSSQPFCGGRAMGSCQPRRMAINRSPKQRTAPVVAAAEVRKFSIFPSTITAAPISAATA